MYWVQVLRCCQTAKALNWCIIDCVSVRSRNAHVATAADASTCYIETPRANPRLIRPDLTWTRVTAIKAPVRLTMFKTCPIKTC